MWPGATNFAEPILHFLEEAYEKFAELTGRRYGLISEYKTDDTDTVFISLGSAAENIEAAVDYLRQTRGVKVGSIHVNVIRPFPEAAIVKALKGKKNVIILERTDEALSGDNPLGRDIRTALSKAIQYEGHPAAEGLPALAMDEVPHIYSGTYGLGSRDFRPEHIIGAYEFAHQGPRPQGRQDGRRTASASSSSASIILIVWSAMRLRRCCPRARSLCASTPSAAGAPSPPGKNLGAILGDLNDLLFARDGLVDDKGNPRKSFTSAPTRSTVRKRKARPPVTSWSPPRIASASTAICVTSPTVLCCDPKAFTPHQPSRTACRRAAASCGSQKKRASAHGRISPSGRASKSSRKTSASSPCRGFEIARKATDRGDLQLRMQGNAFLGAFFAVSSLLQEFGITQEQFRDVVHKQYVKKFGKLGDAVVQSNMEVMIQGFERVKEIAIGELSAADRFQPARPAAAAHPRHRRGTPWAWARRAALPAAAALHLRLPASPHAHRYQASPHLTQSSAPTTATINPRRRSRPWGVIAAATGDTASKYVARRETPLYIAENCTQCMECISVCPDTALPNTSQDLSTILTMAVSRYVGDPAERSKMLAKVPEIEKQARRAHAGRHQDRHAAA